MVSDSELYSIWQRVLEKFQQKLDNHVFSVFFKDSYIYSIKGNAMFIVWNSKSTATLIENKYKNDVNEAINEVTGSYYQIKHITEEDLNNNSNLKLKEEDVFFKESSLYSQYTFDNFVMGISNKEAAQNSLIVASNPGVMYNPLFIYSDSGLGKTHLLHAIGNYVKESSPRTNILIITTEQFVDEYTKAARGEEDINKLKEFIKKVDILLIDDIQFLANKPKTEEFFFPIFNYFVSNNKQIVLTSDKKPQDLDGLDQRLVTRFSQGLSVNISKPDKDTCVNILKMKIEQEQLNLKFSEDSLSFIADNCSKSVRELEGSLTKILSYSITIKPTDSVDLDYAIQALKGLYGSGKSSILTEERIIDEVAKYYNLTSQQILGHSQIKIISLARHLSMYLIKELMDLPYTKIGYIFGGKDHTTIMSACNKIEKMCKTDPQMWNVVNNLKDKLSAK